MTVRKLIEALSHVNPDAVVYLSNPNHFGSDFQVAHEEVGVRYLVNGNEEVWFETYGQENIDDEVRAFGEYAIECGMSDADFVSELFDPDGHGYTLEDIRKNCGDGAYEFCKRTKEENGL